MDKVRTIVALSVAAGAVGAAAAIAAPAQPAQKVTGPVAVYWMSAQTQTGFGMPSAGGAAPNPMAMMRQMMGGGGASKSLTLQLGSSQTAPAPAADHLPPPGLQAGAALPLLTPKVAPPQPAEPGQIPREMQKPRGRMLIFWGCGEHARAGQPVVLDFAKLAGGQVPAGMAALKGLDYRPMTPPSPGRNRTYGEWPNDRTRTTVPPQGSLVGPHTVRGNYAPQIDFALQPNQDFLAPLSLTTNAKTPGGWATLGWNLVPNAQAYLATAMGAGGPGGGDGETIVLWTSSETQAAAFAMPDYLSPGDLGRLTAARALMGPTTQTCTVPKEVVDAAPQAMVQLVAYGGEVNFVYPPRPTDPKATWNQQWAVKVRYRSATGGLLGMDMDAMSGGQGGRRAGRGGPRARTTPAARSRPSRPARRTSSARASSAARCPSRADPEKTRRRGLALAPAPD